MMKIKDTAEGYEVKGVASGRMKPLLKATVVL